MLETDEELIAQVLRHPQRKILTKEQNYALQRQGHYGNRALTWKTLEELNASSWRGGVCIRDIRGTDRNKGRNALLPLYNIPFRYVSSEVECLIRSGIPIEFMSFNQSMPDEHLIMQGEICIIEGIPHLTYSTVKKPMRQALLEETIHENTASRVRVLLGQKINRSSRRDIEYCLKYFSISPSLQSATVEFSAYDNDADVGDTPGKNTIIWEVRNY